MVYVTLLQIVRKFVSRNPLMNGHGDFRSAGEEPTVARRYTAKHLGTIANEKMLDEYGSDTVNFTQNLIARSRTRLGCQPSCPSCC